MAGPISDHWIRRSAWVELGRFAAERTENPRNISRRSSEAPLRANWISSDGGNVLTIPNCKTEES